MHLPRYIYFSFLVFWIFHVVHAINITFIGIYQIQNVYHTNIFHSTSSRRLFLLKSLVNYLRFHGHKYTGKYTSMLHKWFKFGDNHTYYCDYQLSSRSGNRICSTRYWVLELLYVVINEVGGWTSRRFGKSKSGSNPWSKNVKVIAWPSQLLPPFHSRFF